MGRAADPQTHDKYLYVLSLWNVNGYITWTQIARSWVETHLAGYTTKGIGELMYLHVRDGGKIHQITETRPRWLEWPFHYDLYVTLGNREVYIETRFLDERDRDDCTINVVNAHDP